MEFFLCKGFRQAVGRHIDCGDVRKVNKIVFQGFPIDSDGNDLSKRPRWSQFSNPPAPPSTPARGGGLVEEFPYIWTIHLKVSRL